MGRPDPEKTMTCVICKTGDLGPGHTTVSLGRGGTTVVTENVPAEVCDNCGEAYLSAAITEQLQRSPSTRR